MNVVVSKTEFKMCCLLLNMNTHPRVSYAASGQSWPVENWVRNSAGDDQSGQTTCCIDNIQNWRPPDPPTEQQQRLGMGFDVPSVESNSTSWTSDERQTLDNIDRSQQLIKEDIAEWRLRDGQDPDCAEFERLRTPTYTIVESELSEVLHRRVVIIESLTMAELSHPRLLEVMSRANEFRISYIYKENSASSHNVVNTSLWEGLVILFLRSITDAAEAVKYLQAIRENLEVRILQASENLAHLVDTWRNGLKSSMRRLTDDLLIVSRVTSSVTREKLQEVFPDALDIVIPREKVSDCGDDVRTVKGYAYLTFGNRSKMLEAFSKYSSQPIYISGHLLRVAKYEPPKDIPLGYLRLRRRLRALDLIRDLRRAEAVAGRFEKGVRDQVNQHLDEWTVLVEKDDVIRKSLHLPAPSLDELRLLFDMQLPTDEKPMDRDDIDELLAASRCEQNRLKEIKTVHLASKTSFRRHDSQKQAAWRKAAANKLKGALPSEPPREGYPSWDDECREPAESYRRPTLTIRKRSPGRTTRRGFPFRRRPLLRGNAFGRGMRSN